MSRKFNNILRQEYVVLRAFCQCNVVTVLLLILNLLLQGCQSKLEALEEHFLSAKAYPKSELQGPTCGQVSTPLTTPLSSVPRHPTPSTFYDTAVPTAVKRRPQHTTTRQTTQASSRIFTTSSGERVRFTHESGQWQATLQSLSRAITLQHTFPVLSATSIGPQLAWLQTQNIWTSKARIHIISTSMPPYTSCVYLGKCGLFGGMFFGNDHQELPESNRRTPQASEGAARERFRTIPSLSSLCIESLLAAHEDEDYQRNAECHLIAAAKVVAPEQTLKRLLTAYKTNPGIRKTASEAFLEATKVEPESTIDHLLTACKNASTQQVAVSMLENLATAVPQLILIPLQASSRQADSSSIRRAAIKTLESVAKAAPELASACLETILLATSRDESDLVRDSSFRVLLNIAKAAPEQTLAPLLTFEKNESWYTRYAVIMALLEIAQAAPEHASACLQPLKDACRDDDHGVCQAAIYALVETEKALRCYERGI